MPTHRYGEDPSTRGCILCNGGKLGQLHRDKKWGQLSLGRAREAAFRQNRCKGTWAKWVAAHLKCQSYAFKLPDLYNTLGPYPLFSLFHGWSDAKGNSKPTFKKTCFLAGRWCGKCNNAICKLTNTKNWYKGSIWRKYGAQDKRRQWWFTCSYSKHTPPPTKLRPPPQQGKKKQKFCLCLRSCVVFYCSRSPHSWSFYPLCPNYVMVGAAVKYPAEISPGKMWST